MRQTSDFFYHEARHRSGEVMQRIRDFAVTVCGAGALGANIAESLARQGLARLKVIDRDRIEERNLSTQPYYRTDIGAHKGKILANALYRALGVAVETCTDELTPANAARLLRGSDLVVDTFDNSAGRKVVTETCSALGVPCLHVGLAGEYAEILWNEGYRTPSAAQDDVCDYALARNLVTLAVSVACEVIVAFATTGEQRAYTVTLGDFAIRPAEF
jgi:molybdopterin/thiamine biosynthesis adenylyltransferase